MFIAKEFVKSKDIDGLIANANEISLSKTVTTFTQLIMAIKFTNWPYTAVVTATAAFAFASISLVAATPLEKRQPKVFSLDFDVVRNNNTATGLKRDETIDAEYFDASYLASISLGSNKQVLNVSVDTGSSDLVIPKAGVNCEGHNCLSGGVFDPSESTTFHDLSIPITASYEDGTVVKGTFGKDDYYFADGTKVPQLEFGLMSQMPRKYGLFGVGKISMESTPAHYNNFPFALKDAGIIDTVAYSMYLKYPESSGSFLFGGVDKAKYSGELAILDAANFTWLGVTLNSITTPKGQVIAMNEPVALDSGTTYILLGQPLVDAINKELGLSQEGVIECSQISANNLPTFTFNFGSVNITVPLSELFDVVDGECFTRIVALSSGASFLGDSFLRSAYVSYNLESNKIGLAQAKYTSDSDIVDFWF